MCVKYGVYIALRGLWGFILFDKQKPFINDWASRGWGRNWKIIEKGKKSVLKSSFHFHMFNMSWPFSLISLKQVVS